MQQSQGGFIANTFNGMMGVHDGNEHSRIMSAKCWDVHATFVLVCGSLMAAKMSIHSSVESGGHATDMLGENMNWVAVYFPMC